MGRTIIVGDVHGCARELDKLFDKLALARGDQLIMVGDLVVRGPNPNRVLRLVREADGVSVRGNHEQRLLTWRDLQRRRRRRAAGGGGPFEERLIHNKMLRRTAAEIDDQGWADIERMPLWVELPDQALLVVHAGVLPGVPLRKQDEHTLMYIRGVSPDGDAVERRDMGEPWGKRYRGPPHVVHGHNALREPQLYPWVTGIDTGCVYGGRLTALVLPEGKRVPRSYDLRRELLVSVKARRRYEEIA